MAHKILVAQGGGPTAVINQSLVGVALEARRFPSISHVYGAVHGVRGIVDEELIDLGHETSDNLLAVAATPAAALGSTRDKPDIKYCHEIFRVLRAHEIDTFFYIGGNDSSDTVRIVAEEAHKAGHPIRAIHIPKTIDNDLVGFDHTPGFPSAARFVTQAFMGANLDNSALKGVYCAVIMGRHAGFLTAASALARKYPDDGPHLIYLPERVFVIDRFLADVKRTYEKYGRCVIAASEGIHDEHGAPIVAKLAGELERDAHGNVQLSGTGALADLLCEEVKLKLGIKRVRGDTFGYLQRSFVGCVSDVDQREAREVGEKAVQYAMWEGRNGSVSIRRIGNYAVDYPLIPLETVAGKTRVMEDAFIGPDANDVTPAFVDYLRPLLGSECRASRGCVKTGCRRRRSEGRGGGRGLCGTPRGQREASVRRFPFVSGPSRQDGGFGNPKKPRLGRPCRGSALPHHSVIAISRPRRTISRVSRSRSELLVRWLLMATLRQWRPRTVVSDTAAMPSSCNRIMISMFRRFNSASPRPGGRKRKQTMLIEVGAMLSSSGSAAINASRRRACAIF